MKKLNLETLRVVFRGRSWTFLASIFRAAHRSYNGPSYRNGAFGVRLVRSKR